MMKNSNPTKVRKVLFMGFLFTLVMAVIIGCATIPETTTRPPVCADSLIYGKIPFPEIVSTGAILATCEYAKGNPERRAILEETFVYAESIVSRENITASDVAMQLAERFEWVNRSFGVELIILSELLAPLRQPVPLSDCDRQFLCDHFQKQRRYLALIR